VVSLLKVAEAEMMVAARVDGGWIAVEEKAFTRLLKIILRLHILETFYVHRNKIHPTISHNIYLIFDYTRCIIYRIY
jgi:hypothetical protein